MWPLAQSGLDLAPAGIDWAGPTVGGSMANTVTELLHVLRHRNNEVQNIPFAVERFKNVSSYKLCASEAKCA